MLSEAGVHPPDSGKLTLREALVILEAKERNDYRREQELLRAVYGSKVNKIMPPLQPAGRRIDENVERERRKKEQADKEARMDWAFWKANQKDGDEKS